MKIRKTFQLGMLMALMIVIGGVSTRLRADTGTCGGASVTLPFNDVMNSAFFCQIAEAYFTGLTNGTSTTTYDPSSNVTREQMAAFITRTMDQTLKRGSERTALTRFWTKNAGSTVGVTTVGDQPYAVESDGTDLWVPNRNSGTISRVAGSSGRLLETWTGADTPQGVLCAMGKIFVIGGTNSLYQIDPRQVAGAVTAVTTNLGLGPNGIAFDGQHIWTANNNSPNGGVSIVSLPSFTVSTVTTGFHQPIGILFDGANIWVTDHGDNTLKKLDSSGNILSSVSVGSTPQFPAFDGTNIWVPNYDSHTVSVVRATGGLAGTVVATLPGNGMFGPIRAAFDGERVLVTNARNGVLSLWNASSLIPIGNFPTPGISSPQGVCSDGLNFWITFVATDQLVRF